MGDIADDQTEVMMDSDCEWCGKHALACRCDGKMQPS